MHAQSFAQPHANASKTVGLVWKPGQYWNEMSGRNLEMSNANFNEKLICSSAIETPEQELVESESSFELANSDANLQSGDTKRIDICQFKLQAQRPLCIRNILTHNVRR
jgi:hypothetical protein